MAIFGLLATFVLSMAHPLALRTSPRIAQIRCNLHVEARVLPQKQNRALIILVSGEESFYSEMPLNGEDEPIVHVRDYADLGPGEYEIKAILVTTKEHFVETSHLTVIAP